VILDLLLLASLTCAVVVKVLLDLLGDLGLVAVGVVGDCGSYETK